MEFIHEQNSIFVEDEDGDIIVLATFPFKKENVIDVKSTFVTPALRGHGVASKLMHEVYNHAKDHNYKVVNTCPYAVVWFKKNKDKHDVLYIEEE